MTITNTSAATTQSMKTCLVTEKSIPRRWEVNQRVIDRAVRDVLDDDFTGIELPGGLETAPAAGSTLFGLKHRVDRSLKRVRSLGERRSFINSRRRNIASIVCSAMKYAAKLTTNGTGRRFRPRSITPT